MNIIVLVIDTLRYDYIGAHGNDFIQTPNLDRLAAESRVFDRCFCGSFPTIPHRTDLITGRYGSPFHVWQPLAYDVPTMPRILADEKGYATQIIHDTPHLVNGGHHFDWPFHYWTFVRGAEVDRAWLTESAEKMPNWQDDPVLDDFEPANPDSDNCWYWRGHSRANLPRERLEDWNCARLFSTASKFLKDNAGREDFLLWLDCFDPHEPWDAPPEFMLKYDKTPGYDGRIDLRLLQYRNDPNLPDIARERIKHSYAAKVSWVDHCLGRFLDTLESSGLKEKTMLVLTADHGTNVGERNRFGKGFPVREQEAHVPLMIRTPDGDTGRSDIICQPQDITATLMAAAGGALPEGSHGYDVLTQARDGKAGEREVALSSTALAERGCLFTVYDREWYLEAAVTPETSRLTRLGTLETVQDNNPDVVNRLHAAGIRELGRRGTAPEIMDWIKAGGEGEFPDVPLYDPWPKPAGYKPYFNIAYRE